ncbi:MAG: molybdenum cofactor biosynthesis protein MoaE [Anaerolineales bacterium]|nr:molybdenum cofactor biosynthesis protein MoaE [Anaerolineales bacterium]
MKLTVRLYASLRDRAGQSKIEVVLPDVDSVTVADLHTAVVEQYPHLEAGLNTAIVAVNQEFAAPQTPLTASDEIALFPPVSGGSETPHPTYFALATAPPDLNDIHGRLRRDDVGAIITFSGYVRGQTARPGWPQTTIELEYEAYADMAERKMAQIAAEIWHKWPDVKGIAIIQRIGKLAVGEATTLVTCAAGHRDQGAFEAARYGIDRLKEIVPVWKKEIGPDHSVWVEGDYRPTPNDNR